MIAPPGSVTEVSVINTCFLREIPIENYMQPIIPGNEHMNVPCYVFLLRNNEDRKVLFDLGLRNDWKKLSPSVQGEIEREHIKITMDQDVIESLDQHGIAPGDVEAIVLSHHHFDHIGDPSLFPDQTNIVVGPGFSKAYMPGYPLGKDSSILESDYSGKRVIEINFKGSEGIVQIGPWRGFDYFGDGSFYVLDAPGHTIGHVCGLVRTTRNPDTFLLLGGDACHNNGEFRPSKQQPLPDTITPDPFARRGVRSCPGAAFERYLANIGKSRAEPFFEIPKGLQYAEFCHDVVDAAATIERLQALDGYDNVFVILAHDDSIRHIVEFFPKTLNTWKARGWGQLGRWAFLKDFLSIEQPVVDGIGSR
ncbi:uncharacterized protein A1O9_08353 [Exophiala aquamarina CBS 119918]|uniref:Metallo-beta-lactamase domain-containing protein n=1 Tax=Exophiala aquamarina CBS 119918 TaxID=1182545 RepID=A0A072P8J1_9EURO|nr:uncharacterized protein A1O9_08353 [Exophiala aquamarina CBS 119918]KEF55603.1 hypothetical protein A1O9_08353 [Exophiala aquamarina CBS 119918]